MKSATLELNSKGVKRIVAYNSKDIKYKQKKQQDSK